ncbi:DASH complex subunit Dad4 [Phytophthora cactorum]|nr:DASH complex subunit Dad4 [Phytophthora cactorum]
MHSLASNITNNCMHIVQIPTKKQKALLQRITGSVARLHEVIKEINTQLRCKSDSFREDLALTCQVWKGYESRVQSHCDTAIAAAAQQQR